MHPGNPSTTQRGATLVEVLVAVVIMGFVTSGALILYRAISDEATSQRTRGSLKEELTMVTGRLRKEFAARAQGKPLALSAKSLGIPGRPKNAPQTILAQRVLYDTQCVALPANHGLAAAELNKLATLAPCMPCPSGKRPVMKYKNNESGITLQFPADGGGGMTQRPIAGAVCVQSTTSAAGVAQTEINVTTIMAIITPEHRVVRSEDHLLLTTESVNKNVEIIR